MSRRAVPALPRPETIAFARRGRARPASYASMIAEMAIEDELIFTRAMAMKLLRLLQLREPTVADSFLNDLTIDGRATLDRDWEAMLVLFFRHQIDVAPVRKLLWAQDQLPDQFVLTRPGGDPQVVDRETLMMMAGISL